MERAEIHRVMEDLQMGILITDGDLRVTYANRFESDFYGLSKEELLGRDIMVDCHKPRSRETIARMVERMKTGEIEEHGKFSVGQLIRYKARRAGDGSFAGIIRTRMWLPEGFDPAQAELARRQASE